MPPRPNEGVLLVNVELSPIAAPKFEAGRMSDEGVEINRFEYWWTLVALSIFPQNPWTVFERESVSWSGESLHHIWGKGLPCRLNWFKRTRHSTAMCKVKISYQVWTVRLDLHVLCHEGSLADACSVAGLAALSHFRRPDVTLKVFLLLPLVNHNLWRTNRETWWLCIQLMSGTQYLWLSTTILSLPPLQCFRCEIKFSSLSLSQLSLLSDGWKHWDTDSVWTREVGGGCDDGKDGDRGQCLQGGLHPSLGRTGNLSGFYILMLDLENIYFLGACGQRPCDTVIHHRCRESKEDCDQN